MAFGHIGSVVAGFQLRVSGWFPVADSVFGIRVLGSGFCVPALNPGFWVSGSGSSVLDSQKIQGPRVHIQSAQVQCLGAGSRVPGARFRVLGPTPNLAFCSGVSSEFWVLGSRSGFCVLGSRYWILGPGSWVPCPGLIFGFWVPCSKSRPGSRIPGPIQVSGSRALGDPGGCMKPGIVIRKYE